MKKFIGIVGVLGFVAIGLSACSQKEAPVQEEVVASVQLPAHNLVEGAGTTAGEVTGSVQETVTETVADVGGAAAFVEDRLTEVFDDAGNETGLVEDTLVDVVTDTGEVVESAQETVAEVMPDGDLLVESVQETADVTDEYAVLQSVTAAAQSSTQSLIREGDAITGGVVSSAISSSQAISAGDMPIEETEVTEEAAEETVPENPETEQNPS